MPFIWFTQITIYKCIGYGLCFLQFQVQVAIQQVHNIICRCLATHDKLEASLRDLSRTGEVQACKAARKSADGLLKELSKDLKPLMTFLQSSPSAAQVLSKVHLSFTCCCLV